MTRKEHQSDEKEHRLEPHPPEDEDPERSPLQRLKDKLLKKLRKDDPNVYPLY